jgi:hypothetical protein
MKQKNSNLTDTNIKKINLLLINIALFVLYFFAVANLGYAIRNTLGYFPEILYTFFPFMEYLFNIKILRILATPEKMYIFYMLLLEFCINKSVIELPIILKYNILLIFFLEMMQNLIVCYWDLIFNKELLVYSSNYYIYDKNIANFMGIILFVFFFNLYTVAFIQSIFKRVPKFPGFLNEINNSIAFWLKIKKLS